MPSARSPSPGYIFVKWKTSGDITVADPNAIATTDTVAGSGTLAAVYRLPITPVSKPVGGLVMSTNKLEILTPSLALARLIVDVSAVVVVRKRSD